ncbi:MAG TPA: permease [Porticoccaceae bacterium]|jgi:uncharacterized membrane protein YfcA|nr:permease [Porticoccaceae bacterium]
MEFSALQYALIALVFIWSGFVRSGLGFGGALFTIPFLLLIHNDPLFFLPIISLHLLFFASITFLQSHYQNHHGIDSSQLNPPRVSWSFVRFALLIMLAPKITGVIGLIVLPANIMNSIIFLMIAGYSITYITGRPLQSNSRTLDIVFLIIGAYVSGTSLLGGPLIIAVALRHIEISAFRHTLFVLWSVLVSIKLAAFVWAGVSLNLLVALWLLPFAGIGHLVGQRMHEQLIKQDTTKFYTIIGWALLATAVVGLYPFQI